MNKLNLDSVSRFSLPVILISLLTACGGGSGDGSVIATTPVTVSQTSKNIFLNDTYDDTEISIDTNGDSIVRTKLAILFKPTATTDKVDELLARFNATITAAVAGARSVSIRIPDPDNVDNLNVIIDMIATEEFVEAVLKSRVKTPTALPVNVTEDSAADYEIINNHLAVGAAAAWNARAATVSTPGLIIMDWFGFGEVQLTNYLDADNTGLILNGAPNPNDHGYHVAGIAAGSYGGDTSTAGLVSGMFPEHSRIFFVDLSRPMSDFDMQVYIVQAAAAITSTMVLNTSMGSVCHPSNMSGTTCRDPLVAMKEAILWVDLVRAADLESRLFHVTAAGNRSLPDYALRDTQTQDSFSTAATMTDMVDAAGVAVPALTNTMVVENLVGTASHPRKISCLSENSFVGGTISAIGTDVTSLTPAGTGVKSGTSMAAPQVAGLAAYMLAIDPDLTPQGIKRILLATSQVVPANAGCSDWASPAPAIDAYAAVLALDNASALAGNRSEASVRNAILDISTDGAQPGTNGQFDENDLIYFIDEIDTGTQEIKDSIEKVKYSRSDLNGDGYDGGIDGYKNKFNLDINFPPTFTTLSKIIEDQTVNFDESALTDNEILCYYAYSNLYTGDTAVRTSLMADRCRASNLAVYYEHFSHITYPGFSPTACGTDSVDQETHENNTDDMPLLTELTPLSDYWLGDASVASHLLEGNIARGIPNGSGGCAAVTLYAKAELDSTIQNIDDSDRLDIDISANASAECVVAIGGNPDVNACSDSQAVTQWFARYDLDVSEPATYQLELTLDCSWVIPSSLPAPASNLTAVVTRFQPDGTVILTNQDISKLVFPISEACDSDHPTIRINQTMEFDAAVGSPDTKDRITVFIVGGLGAIVTGATTTESGITENTATMNGYVSVKNVNRL